MTFFVTVGPFLGWLLALMFAFGIISFSAKVFSKQIRAWRAGIRLKRCPEWEALQSVQPPEGAVSLGPVKRKRVLGPLFLLLGVLSLLWVLLLLVRDTGSDPRIAVVFLLGISAVLFLYGIPWTVGQCQYFCPHCGQGSWFKIGRPCHICLFCGCVSIRQGDMLTPEETIRAMPRFRDLPKF